jgi:hypothetical protein
MAEGDDVLEEKKWIKIEITNGVEDNPANIDSNKNECIKIGTANGWEEIADLGDLCQIGCAILWNRGIKLFCLLNVKISLSDALYFNSDAVNIKLGMLEIDSVEYVTKITRREYLRNIKSKRHHYN